MPDETKSIIPALIRLELQHLTQSFDGLKYSVDKILHDHEMRIRELNDSRMKLLGAAALAGAIAGILAKVLLR